MGEQSLAPTPLGTAFPPRSWREIEAYDLDDLVLGFIEWSPDDIAPGENRSPAYRWGWANAAFDHGIDDGCGGLRWEFARQRRVALAHHDKPETDSTLPSAHESDGGRGG